MDVYAFDRLTGEYVGITAADPDPLAEGQWLVPAFATPVVPPAPVVGFARVFVSGIWSLVEDHRGETWWRGHGDPVAIDEIGADAVDGLSEAEPPAPAPTQADLIIHVAVARWRKETGGITIGGLSIVTDRESQAMIIGAHAYVVANPAAVIQWKTAAGFVELDAAQITGLALAVGSHVQACFVKEAEVVGAIAEYATRAEIDAAFAAVQTAY
ncbi:DUF4376 domain-containing protein [Xanthobacteraceae bacterium Astr-EGSB]|uniref:DUF4376 domain-containing protein n=1 Tax=Astrobacterium formosum TaxID=3069710 RepID=UPI0027B28578|nr:DUF4376 domain-containing protein [Xanthobacteraceae bacterium Astr-EGSB]